MSISISTVFSSSLSSSLASIDAPYTPPRLLDSFLSNRDCDLLMNVASKKGFFDSTILGRRNKDRKSKTCWLKLGEDPIIFEIYQKILDIFPTTTLQNLESIQVAHYDEGGYFDDHFDQCIPNQNKSEECQQELAHYGGPRWCTVLIYLNDGYEGGETSFPRLDLSFKGKKGDALVFHTLDESRKAIHPLSLHRGCLVSKGQKWIANVWIRLL
jgi:prolyl 4-hydroxylase